MNEINVEGKNCNLICNIKIKPITEEEKKNLKTGQKVLVMCEYLGSAFNTPFLTYVNNIVYIFPAEKEEKVEKKEINFHKIALKICDDNKDANRDGIGMLMDVIKQLAEQVKELQNEKNKEKL